MTKSLPSFASFQYKNTCKKHGNFWRKILILYRTHLWIWGKSDKHKNMARGVVKTCSFSCWHSLCIWDDLASGLWHLQLSFFFFSFSLYFLPDKGGGMYTAVPQTDPLECINCRNCRNNNRYVDVYLPRWWGIGIWLLLLFSLQQRKFLNFYQRYKF